VNGIKVPVISNMFADRQRMSKQQLPQPAKRRSRRRSSTLPIRAAPVQSRVQWRTDIFGNPQGTARLAMLNAQRAALPSTNGQNLGGGAVGLPYELLGMVNNAFVSNQTDPNWRKPPSRCFQDT
jgi:hypothetical protein